MPDDLPPSTLALMGRLAPNTNFGRDIDAEAHKEWQAHVDAGRIGRKPEGPAAPPPVDRSLGLEALLPLMRRAVR